MLTTVPLSQDDRVYRPTNQLIAKARYIFAPRPQMNLRASPRCRRVLPSPPPSQSHISATHEARTPPAPAAPPISETNVTTRGRCVPEGISAPCNFALYFPRSNQLERPGATPRLGSCLSGLARPRPQRSLSRRFLLVDSARARTAPPFGSWPAAVLRSPGGLISN